MTDLDTLLLSLTPIKSILMAILAFHFSFHSSNNTTRLLLLPLFLYFTMLSFITSDKFFIPSLTSLWAQSVALNIVHIISLLFIEKHPAPRLSNCQSILQPSTFLTTLRFWSNPQLLPRARTRAAPLPNQVSPAPAPKSVFVLLRLAKLSLYYHIHTHILPALFSETIMEIYPLDVSETALLSRLGRVSSREAVVRSYVALSWVWESIVFLDGANALLSLFGVLSGLDLPADWPSMFGGLDEVRGLRTFWARFWHRLASRPYKSCGRAVASGVASLSSRAGGRRLRWVASPRVQGTIVAFVVFLISGLSHAAVSWRLGMQDWLDVQWFLLNFVACLVETCFLSAVRHLAGRIRLAKQLEAVERSWLGRVVGYLWVFGFFFWSVPLWRFPRMHRVLKTPKTWKSA